MAQAQHPAHRPQQHHWMTADWLHQRKLALIKHRHVAQPHAQLSQSLQKSVRPFHAAVRTTPHLMHCAQKHARAGPNGDAHAESLTRQHVLGVLPGQVPGRAGDDAARLRMPSICRGWCSPRPVCGRCASPAHLTRQQGAHIWPQGYVCQRAGGRGICPPYAWGPGRCPRL